MAGQTGRSTRNKSKNAEKELKKPWVWAAKEIKITKANVESMYQAAHSLNKDTRERAGLVMKIPVFIQDPLVALDHPTIGVQEIEVRLEAGFGDGPTSARLAVVDYNADTQRVLDPVEWVEKSGWFRTPGGDWLPEAPRDLTNVKDPQKYAPEYRQFIETVIKNPHFHQVNVWTIVQRVLEFYEDAQALGRPIPWGFDGNRLIVVPHAGYGENAYYDQTTKSLQFYYFGSDEAPTYTCLSHDIIAHETGHAVLDGIRPLYNENPSVQTAAFHEYIGDLTAILLALFNKDIRHFIAEQTEGDLKKADVLANVAEQFGQDIYERPYLRSATNEYTLEDNEIKNSMSAHKVSQVMTGAMFSILIGIARSHMAKNLPDPTETSSGNGEAESDDDGAPVKIQRKVTSAQALWWAAERFRRVALQPLDLCPPCDIQFIDYAKAVIRNDVLTNPVDSEGYRETMLEVFHQRKLCSCSYQKGQDLPWNCEFMEAVFQPKLDFITHDIGRVARSRTAAYYFLNDNRNLLRIPEHQDIVIADLYDTNKLGALAERLPRQVVLEYVWKEELEFKDDPASGLVFDWLQGKKIDLYCGGTLVFDDRGNLLSWFRKPGLQLLSPEETEAIRVRKQAWDKDPVKAKKDGIKRPTQHETALLADMDAGQERVRTFLEQYNTKLHKGKINKLAQDTSPLGMQQPVSWIEEDGVMRFYNTPHLRKEDLDTEDTGWAINF
ncbi:MAG TPA: hypothetical protein VLA49_21805 [Anaerolineales bacterium]|nr:hypothetical protein [Anaerolineales bacterium]